MKRPGDKTFKLVWCDGKEQYIYGRDVSEAFNNAGYGGGAIAALDYYEEIKPKKLTVNLTYFREGGKYYSSGSYETDKEDLGKIWQEVREFKFNGRLPDLVEGATEFYILIEVPDHPYNHPRLIPC
jgi:hypothetical protein